MQYVTPATARSSSTSSSQLGLGYGSGTGSGGGYYGPINDPFSFRDNSNDPVQAAETVYTPLRAEAMLTQEMLQLSFTDRNDVQEEIHGTVVVDDSRTVIIVVGIVWRCTVKKIIQTNNNRWFGVLFLCFFDFFSLPFWFIPSLLVSLCLSPFLSCSIY